MSDEVAERARELFLSSYNCAESVLSANMERLGIEGDWFPGVATGFAAGIGRSGMVCGAIVGAVIAAGAVLGRGRPDEDIDALIEFAASLVRDFTAEFGSCSCALLINRDVSTPEGLQKAREEGVFESVCPPFVEFCAAAAAAAV
ncbi:MAG: C-GCAxxG-C-C family protein [Actinomycetota bacterium]